MHRMNLTPRLWESPWVTESLTGVKERAWVPSPFLESQASPWSAISYSKRSSQRWNKEPFSFWRTPVLCGAGKDWTNPPEAWAVAVTGIWDFPSEGFTLNLLPKASPGESVWTQQSSGFKVTVTLYVPGRRWRMSPSFFLKLPSLLCTGPKNTEKRDLVQESRDLGCHSAPVSNELGNHFSLAPSFSKEENWGDCHLP